MILFLWVLIVILALSSLGKLVMLAKGGVPHSNPAMEAFDVAANSALLVWAAVLLVGL
jgi:hypothetical protein